MALEGGNDWPHGSAFLEGERASDFMEGVWGLAMLRCWLVESERERKGEGYLTFGIFIQSSIKPPNLNSLDTCLLQKDPLFSPSPLLADST